jgi:hypothetical protein
VSALDKLRDFSLVLLVVDIPPPRLRNEDGSPMILASDEDVLYESLEFLTMERVKVTRDPSQTYEAVVVVMTEGWKDSPQVTGAIQRAKKSKMPLFLCDPQSRRVVRGSDE